MAEGELLQPLGSDYNAKTAEIMAKTLANDKVTSQYVDDNQFKYFEELGEEKQELKDEYSLLAWAKGMLNDLGLGFGWSAFYFTVFTAWFDGQTLGKKLFRIRVVQLDGTRLSLWDSFGRYGGYGAGFATGLLGFLQICWDANRQAIQDKISATVVIDLNRLTQEQTSSYETKL